MRHMTLTYNSRHSTTHITYIYLYPTSNANYFADLDGLKINFVMLASMVRVSVLQLVSRGRFSVVSVGQPQ